MSVPCQVMRRLVTAVCFCLTVALGGCKRSCTDGDPALTVTVHVPPATVTLDVTATAQERAGPPRTGDRSYPLDAAVLADSQTSFVVWTGTTPGTPFDATISVVAKDGAGKVIAAATQRAPGLGNACNEVSLDLVQQPDQRVDRPASDGSRRDRGADGSPCSPAETRPCSTSLPGVCKAGQQTCTTAGQWGSCTPITQPSKEVCDNLDNNCDGSTDEGLAVSSSTGCWDVVGRFAVTNNTNPAKGNKIFGTAATNGQDHYALLNASDNTYAPSVTSVSCAGTTKSGSESWHIERLKVDDSTYKVLVRGVSRGLTVGLHEACSGSVKINPTRWKIASIPKCNIQADANGAPTSCHPATDPPDMVSWSSGSMCSICACPEAARVDIEIDLSRK